MKVLSFVVFLIAIQAVISVSISAVNTVQSIGSSVTSALPSEHTISQSVSEIVTEGERAAQSLIGGSNTGAIFTQETLKRF